MADVLASSDPLTPETYEAFLEEVATYSYAEDEETNADLSELGLSLALDYVGILEASPKRSF